MRSSRPAATGGQAGGGAAGREPQPIGDDSVVATNRGRAVSGRLTPFLAISVGGVLGANARYFLGLWMTAWLGPGFPAATMLINVTGSFGLGLYLTLVAGRYTGHQAIRLLVATGFFGAYTTFSTFSVEAIHLLEAGDDAAGLAYVIGSVVLSIAAAAIGIGVARMALARFAGSVKGPRA